MIQQASCNTTGRVRKATGRAVAHDHGSRHSFLSHYGGWHEAESADAMRNTERLQIATSDRCFYLLPNITQEVTCF